MASDLGIGNSALGLLTRLAVFWAERGVVAGWSALVASEGASFFRHYAQMISGINVLLLVWLSGGGIIWIHARLSSRGRLRCSAMGLARRLLAGEPLSRQAVACSASVLLGRVVRRHCGLVGGNITGRGTGRALPQPQVNARLFMLFSPRATCRSSGFHAGAGGGRRDLSDLAVGSPPYPVSQGSGGM